jgi:hypothetical protein
MTPQNEHCADARVPVDPLVRLVGWLPPRPWQIKNLRLHPAWKVGVYSSPDGLFSAWQYVSFSADGPDGKRVDAISEVASRYAGDWSFDAVRA